jgi:hypothetical protein
MRPFPPRLYKYLGLVEHAQNLLDRGQVRIGTLFDFRKDDIHDPERGDDDEGTPYTFVQFADVTLTANSSADTLEQAFLRRYAGTAITQPMHFRDHTLMLERVDENAYVYCLSDRWSEDLLDVFNAEACVEVVNPAGFFRALSDHVVDRFHTKRTQAGPVTYDVLDGPYRSVHELPSCFVKHPRFSRQCEHRLVWYTDASPITPELVAVPALTSFVRPLQMS